MIWRVIMFWLLGASLAFADIPRHFKTPTPVNFQYDGNGNLTNDGTRSFAYDAENQLTNVFASNAWRVGFVYDGLNRRRISRYYAWQGSGWAETNEVHYIYDGLLVLQERDTNNNPQVTYTRGLDLSLSRQGAGGIGGLLARTDTNGSTYYHADGNGNITAMMDGNQNIVARYRYDGFGKLLGKWGSLADANTYRYSSKDYDRNSGMYYYGFRFYEPNFQRWLNRDPIQERGGINLYQFNRNNPLRFVDPYGLDEFAASIALSRGGGLLAEEEAGGWVAGGNFDPYVDAGLALTAIGIIGYAAWEYFEPPTSPPPTPALPNATSTTPAKPVPTTCPAKAKPISNPPTGQPGSKATATNPDGTPKQVRQYGPDGYPETDVDYGHGHELDPNGNPVGSPHAHDWEPNPNGSFPNRSPARSPQPGDPQP
jgi:RHS repeat-associated protein